MRLRQVVLAAWDMASAQEDLFAVLGLQDAFRDTGVSAFGLRNIVMPLGDTFLEVVSPKQPDTAAGRFLERIGGDGGYMLIVQVDDLASERRRVERLGARIVWTADHETASAIHLHPKDVGGAILSLDEMRPPESWLWAGPDWPSRRAEAARTISSAQLFAAEPAALQRRWTEVLGGRRPRNAALEFEIDLDGRGDRVGALTVRTDDLRGVLAAARSRGLRVEENCVTICGTEFRFHE